MSDDSKTVQIPGFVKIFLLFVLFTAVYYILFMLVIGLSARILFDRDTVRFAAGTVIFVAGILSALSMYLAGPHKLMDA